ncbi:MAG: carbonic anhydrase [Clostridia bacterium]|nr:carbonic anhydrase [Clostridia bacterium]
MGKEHYEYSAEVALERLKAGNRKYVEGSFTSTDISRAVLKRFKDYGQHPYAIVITCSDSRVVPELIFGTGIGDLFVIRLAGNVIDSHQLGSIEYAADHLGTGLVVVLGHTNCGAVDAVLAGHSGEYIKFIAESIKEAIGEEKDPYEACRKNVEHCCRRIESSLVIQADEKKYGLKVMGAIYDIETGEVKFL